MKHVEFDTTRVKFDTEFDNGMSNLMSNSTCFVSNLTSSSTTACQIRHAACQIRHRIRQRHVEFDVKLDTDVVKFDIVSEI